MRLGIRNKHATVARTLARGAAMNKSTSKKKITRKQAPSLQKRSEAFRRSAEAQGTASEILRNPSKGDAYGR
jgi:hypothetical protein